MAGGADPSSGGSVGGQVGAAYRGSLKGMKGGTILIGGSDAGIEVGMRMQPGDHCGQGDGEGLHGACR